MKLNKMSTKELIAKFAKMTGITKDEAATKTRDELKAELEMQLRLAEVEATIDDTNLFGEDGADEDIVTEKTIEEKLAECEIDDTNLFGDDGADEDIVTTDETAKGRSAKFADKKLRKAFRHFARRLAVKKNIAWVQVGEDYEVDGEIISWEKFVADHAE